MEPVDEEIKIVVAISWTKNLQSGTINCSSCILLFFEHTRSFQFADFFFHIQCDVIYGPKMSSLVSRW